MKIFLNIICHKSEKIFYKGKIKSLKNNYNGIDVVVSDMKKYWKEGECIQFNTTLHFEVYELKVVEDIIKYIGLEMTDLECNETNNSIEFSLYSTIPEIIESKTVFLTAYIPKE